MGDVDSEMMVLICSPAELSKRVGAVIPASVDGFFDEVCFYLPGDHEVPLATNGSKSIETPVNEVMAGGRRDGRVCNINGIERIGAVRANVIAGCGQRKL